jgi:hypothetical protein
MWTHHRGWFAVLVVAAVALGAGPWFWTRYAHPHAATAGSASAVVEGGSVGAPVRARPAPATAPVAVAATGACGTAMGALRSLMRTYPSGSVVPEAANRKLTAELALLHAACAHDRAAEATFRSRELTPWLTYLPPAAS